MCIFHKWSKWNQYDVNLPKRMITKTYVLLPAIEHRQYKVCGKCGKVKDVIISTVVIEG